MRIQESPLVSILTPSFNQVRWLPYNLDSVTSQTYRPIEHIVMDGASTDGSAELLKQDGRPDLLWRSEPDQGQSDALNKAFRASSGDLIGWVNSDDAYADRRAVQWMVDLFRHYPDVDVAYGYALLVDEVNTVLQVIAAPHFSTRLLRAVHFIYQPTVFVRRRVIEREPTFLRDDLRYVMDRDLWLRLSRTSRFQLLKRVIAIDRHQRSRKVETTPYLVEAEVFNRSFGIVNSPMSGLLARATGAYMRVAGAGTMATLSRSIDPALPLRIPRLPTRMWRQVVVRRRHFRFAPAGQ